MKSLIKELFFDKAIVNEIQKNHISDAQLYNLLNAGKITLKEYVQAVSK